MAWSWINNTTRTPAHTFVYGSFGCDIYKNFIFILCFGFLYEVVGWLPKNILSKMLGLFLHYMQSNWNGYSAECVWKSWISRQASFDDDEKAINVFKHKGKHIHKITEHLKYMYVCMSMHYHSIDSEGKPNVRQRDRNRIKKCGLLNCDVTTTVERMRAL